MGNIWSYNDGNGRLKADYKSSITGVIYPAGSSISLVIINDAETKKILDAAAAEQKKKRAAAAAKAWSDAQSSASSKAELSQIKAAQDYEKSLKVKRPLWPPPRRRARSRVMLPRSRPRRAR